MQRTCAICLGSMKPGNGHALFTAECSHTFHFHCIASNVKHGNQICPVCRAKWKEIPFQGPSSSDLNHGRARINPVDWAQDDNFMTVLRRLPPPRVDTNRQIASSLFPTSEPSSFSDDEPLDPQPQKPEKSSPAMEVDTSRTRTVEIKMYPEFSAVPRSASHENFAVLIHLKAPFTAPRQNSSATQSNVAVARQTSRAPVDLVTVLDVSGSMAGTKLALLKRAMGFVIQNLGPSDRLSVIAFSSTARRLFHLRRMSDSGRQQALQAVNSLTSSGGTNIAEGLRKGAKVMEDRREKNPVCSIILLSDGQDTYTVSGSGAASIRPDYQSLLPSSIRGGAGCQIPVHAFGFGMDHDAASMHSISETSGGTFSFIEAEGVIQDAFAQCIGGLLSVVVQELHVAVESVHPRAPISLIKAGNYTSCISSDGRTGSIDVGDLYADEERDFLVSINVPASNAGEAGTTLVKVGCAYRDPVSKERVNLDGQDVRIQRPEVVSERSVSIEVDRQRNRLQAAEAMAEARAAAERGDLATAVTILERRRRALSESAAARAGDQLCAALNAELKEMQERMATRRVYEASGRAYVLSGLSSHSWQRATARGDSMEGTSLMQVYQTPSMADMLARSQTLGPGGLPHPPPVRPARSFPAQPQPR
ncbi:E3 ubiquitin-protein ligase WAV3-like isoform X2 [Magnolia sinica]|uniref:E3 ubiquitin-protein ligase WAV3-like isoform X2 n=1 Tax=Magnolia sinica TaxID=86752 RepID=UPI002657D616|nr:E3 ubiquitin-protein ligase WAV3-like isoform X2 [Magnolia sinica]